jgi:hypothetical protein
VASRGDEGLGLTREGKDTAQKYAEEGKAKRRTRSGGSSLKPAEIERVAASDAHYRMVRAKPLLMIHSLEPTGEIISGPIAAFGVSFPFGDSATIKAVVNKVWLKQMLGSSDDPDDEEDYDG